MNKYYTYISINKKSIRIEESAAEHKARIERLRKAEYAAKMREREKQSGASPYASLLCPNCKDPKPWNNATKSGDWFCKHCGYAPKTYKGGPKV